MTKPMTKKDAGELLPFFVNGTLEGQEKAAVADAVASDAGLDAEVKALASVRQTVKAIDDTSQSPGELGLKRLMADIERIEGTGPTKIEAANTNAAPYWKKWGGYAVAACIGALAVFVAAPSSNQGDFAVPASGEAVLADPEITITVSFSQDVALADVAALLRRENLVIVDGPTARGLFLLADLDGGALSLAQADRLRGLSSLFATVDDPM